MPKNTDTNALLKGIRFQTMRGSGPGGQHRNKVETAVRAIHIPTGITVIATEYRSQHRNKQLALDRLQNRLSEQNKKLKPRIKTRPNRASVEKRLEQKRQRAKQKRQRQRVVNS